MKDLEPFPCVASASGVSQLEDSLYVKQAVVKMENRNELIGDRGEHYAGTNRLVCWEGAPDISLGIAEDQDVRNVRRVQENFQPWSPALTGAASPAGRIAEDCGEE